MSHRKIVKRLVAKLEECSCITLILVSFSGEKTADCNRIF